MLKFGDFSSHDVSVAEVATVEDVLGFGEGGASVRQLHDVSGIMHNQPASNGLPFELTYEKPHTSTTNRKSQGRRTVMVMNIEIKLLRMTYG